jgi:hypothetical protein
VQEERVQEERAQGKSDRFASAELAGTVSNLWPPGVWTRARAARPAEWVDLTAAGSTDQAANGFP